MDDDRFDELLSLLLDDDLSDDELTELTALVKNSLPRQQRMQEHLETAEMLAHAEDELRCGTLFVSTLMSRIDEESFVSEFRNRLNAPADVAEETSSRSIGLRHLPWVIAAVAVVALGVSVLRTRPVPQVSIATIKSVDGSVQWTGDGGQVNLDPASGLQLSGGTLETLAVDASAELEFRDGSVVSVFGDSAVIISDRQQKILHLGHGMLSADVNAQAAGRPMLIHTPTADIKVVGTEFTINADSSSTVLTVNSGEVSMTRLADGKVVSVPAGHQATASFEKDSYFAAIPQDQPKTVWKSRIPENVNYGELPSAESTHKQGVKAQAVLQRSEERDPKVAYVAALSVSRNEPPVELEAGSRFRVRGRVDQHELVVVGLTTHHARGGFAGKYRVIMHASNFVNPDGSFDIQLAVEKFTPEDSERPASPVGLQVFDWWGVTYEDAGLVIHSVELMSTQEQAPD